MSNNTVDVSVIIPFYKNKDWLQEAIDSVVESVTLNYEIIVINDGSPEDLSGIDELFGNKKIYIYEQINKGPGSARNLGIEKSRGDYIAFLDSDDLFLPHKLEKQMNFMIENNLKWSHSSYIRFDDNGTEFNRLIDNSQFYGRVFPNSIAYCPIATPTVMIEKSIFTNYTFRFSETSRVGEDSFLWNSLALKYYLGVIKEPLAYVRFRGTNATLSAVNHLAARNNFSKYFLKRQNIEIPGILSFLQKISTMGYAIIELLKRLKINKIIVEFIARIIYFPAYLGFKLYWKINKRNRDYKIIK